MHAATSRVLLTSVDALGAGSWLTMTEIARHWPGADRVAAPLKAVDRLLRNPALQTVGPALYGAMSRWLVREARPLIVVDWSDLKADGSFKLLRAGLAVQGRALTLWEEVHPKKSAGKVRVERDFLRRLADRLPQDCRPIVLSDAGFRCPWYRDVLALGWDYVGRVRGTVKVHPYTMSKPRKEGWIGCSDLHARVRRGHSRELNSCYLSKSERLVTRLVLHHAVPKGRRAKALDGSRRRSSASEDAARSAREPWLLATSLSASDCSAMRIARLYQRRMTIEQSFRDLKSSGYGAGFEHTQSHRQHRLANLLLIFALVQFAAWLIALSEERRGYGGRLEAKVTTQRRHHSAMRLGMEILKRPAWWPPASSFVAFLRAFNTDIPVALQTLPA